MTKWRLRPHKGRAIDLHKNLHKLKLETHESYTSQLRINASNSNKVAVVLEKTYKATPTNIVEGCWNWQEHWWRQSLCSNSAQSLDRDHIRGRKEGTRNQSEASVTGCWLVAILLAPALSGDWKFKPCETHLYSFAKFILMWNADSIRQLVLWWVMPREWNRIQNLDAWVSYK